jgi:hypothetical protein
VKSRGFSLIEQSYIIGKMVEKKIRKCALLIAKNCALLFAKTCALLIAKKCALLFTDYNLTDWKSQCPLPPHATSA